MSTVIYQCHHCEEQWRGKDTDNKLFCKNCFTAEKRSAMDEENKNHFAEHGLTYEPPKYE